MNMLVNVIVGIACLIGSNIFAFRVTNNNNPNEVVLGLFVAVCVLTFGLSLIFGLIKIF